VELDDAGPRAAQVRTLLFGEPNDVAEDVSRLWRECSPKHRDVLVAIATAGELSQPELERGLPRLKDAYELRGRHAGIARIAKRVGVSYPIRKAGSHRDTRQFSMEERIRKRILQLNEAK
jgi:hypothetical protein